MAIPRANLGPALMFALVIATALVIVTEVLILRRRSGGPKG
jgi:hypothetical protein